MTNPMEQRMREAVSKILDNMKKLGLDPYIDVDKDYMAVILPVSQLVEMIYRKANTPEVRRHINLEVKESVAGNKGFIVIKATPKT